ncbi:MAG TPA: ABC transporter substrate-binding protein [Chloroflexota bacterium]|nr:ABC transporter substrate-binding protein [Chloroflexota bacterium]
MREGIFSRRELLGLLVSATAGLMVLAGCSGQAAPSSVPALASGKPSAASRAATAAPATPSPPASALSAVKVGFAAPAGNSVPVVVAHDAGIFKQYSLPVETALITGSPNTIAALLANQVQFAVVGASASVQAGIGGADVVDVATLAPGLAFRFYSRPDIKTIQDLKGRRIVQSGQGTDPDFALRLVLQKNHMAYSDVQSVHVPGNDAQRLEAFSASHAAAVIIGPGNFNVAEKQFHLRLLLDVIKEHIPYEAATIAVSRAYTTSHPNEVLAFVKSITAGVKYMHDNRPQTLAAIKTFVKTDSDTVANEEYDYFVTGGVFPKELYVNEAGIQSLLDLVGQTNPKARQHKATDFFDNSFVKQLHDDGFVKQLYGG